MAVDACGEWVWDELLNNAGPDGVCTSLSSCNDVPIMTMVSAAGVAVPQPDAGVLSLKSVAAA